MNSVNLIGNLTKDPEIKYSASGMAYLKISLAVDSYAGKTKGTITNFIPLSVFGQQAEYISSYGHRGDKIWVNGNITQDNWKDPKTGLTRSSVGVVARESGLISGSRRENHKEYDSDQKGQGVESSENLDGGIDYGDPFSEDN